MEGRIGKHKRLIGKAGALDVCWDGHNGRQTQRRKKKITINIDTITAN